MFVQFHFSAVKKVKWNELAVRFLFGGAITAAAGLVAQHWGPSAGGLFLAFPAIFPASVTLLAKKQTQQKAAHGISGAARGKKAAAIDNRGTILGCVGLAAFGLAVWLLPPSLHSVVALLVALGVWSAVSLGLWLFARKIRHA
jgi:hypothetical protein